MKHALALTLVLAGVAATPQRDVTLARTSQADRPETLETLETLEALLAAYASRAEQDAGPSGPHFRSALRAAVADEVAATPALARNLCARTASLDPTTALAVVEGLADAGVLEGLDALAELLRRRPRLQAFTLEAVARLARGFDGPFEPNVLRSVRSTLRAPEREVVVAGARAAGALGDDDAVPALIGLLRSEDRALAAAALDGLVEHTGFDYGIEPEHWLRWYEGERRFLDEDLPRLARELAHGTPEARAAAIKAVVAGRLGVHLRAEVLVETYAQLSRKELRLQALAGFRTLGSQVALPLLEQIAADERDAHVREAAERTAAVLDGGPPPPVR